LYNEVLYDLHCSPNISWADKPKKMRWTEHVARMEDRVA